MPRRFGDDEEVIMSKRVEEILQRDERAVDIAVR